MTTTKTKSKSSKRTSHRARKKPPMNTEFMTERLEDQRLLNQAVGVGFSNDLAVPVGGKRRGGWVSVLDFEDAMAVMDQLSKLPGFPELRFEPDEDDDSGLVRWGEPEPVLPEVMFARHDIERGRYFGYSEAKIREFVNRFYEPRVATAAFETASLESQPRKQKRRKRAVVCN